MNSPYRDLPRCQYCQPGETICTHMGSLMTVQVTKVMFMGATYTDAAYMAWNFFASGGQLHPSVTSVELRSEES
jgi:hypothetical protein